MQFFRACVVFSAWIATVSGAHGVLREDDSTYVKMGCAGAVVNVTNHSKMVSAGTSRLRSKNYRYNNSRHACMCSFLEDAKPANTKMKSVRKLTKCVQGFATTSQARYPCSNVDLMSFVALRELNSIFGSNNDTTNDVWGWTDAETCREIAILGMESGTAFVDITDPTNYLYLGKLPHHDAPSEWRGIKTYKNHAFVISESVNHGMQIFDLKQLIGLRQNRNVFSETYHYDGFGKAHTLFIYEDTGIAFVAGSDQCDGGLYMVDISTPSAPTYAGCFSRDGYTHEPQCVVYHGSDRRYKGREICFACNEDSVTIVDVTVRQRPVQLSRTTYTGTVYTHQGWLTTNHDHFVFGDEFDELEFSSRTRTLVLNLGSNLQNPRFGGVFYSRQRVTDHNQYIVGNRIFQANYQAGLRVLRMNNVAAANFTEVAYFDTYPTGNAFELNGAWSNYPYFPSGTVVLSGIEDGLFVLRPTLPRQITVCPSSDACDADGVAKKCGGFANRFTMRISFIGGVCRDECVPSSEGAARKRKGWLCGSC